MKKRLLSLAVALALLCALLPQAVLPAFAVMDSGTCGDNLTWTLDDDGLLRIEVSGEGSGEMEAYADAADVPWAGWRDQILRVEVREDIKTVSALAFSDCTALTAAVIADSVTLIGESAFSGCTALKELDLGLGIQSIGDGAVAGCAALDHICYAGDADGWKALQIGQNNDPLTAASLPHTANSTAPFLHTGWASLDETGHVSCTLVSATCLEDGRLLYGCYCGHRWEEPSGEPAYGSHDFSVRLDEQCVEPSCLEDGAELYQCSRCDATDTQAVPALGHDYVTDFYPATCVESGFYGDICSRCGDKVVQFLTEDPLGHDWGAVSYDYAADYSYCRASRTCQRDGCGLEEHETALLVSSVTSQPTCTARGATTYFYEFCNTDFGDFEISGHHELTVEFGDEPAGHVWDDGVVTPDDIMPTCSAWGTMTFTCKACGAVETRPTPPIAHPWDPVSEPVWENTGTDHATCTLTQTCPSCGLVKTETVEATFEKFGPTCTENGYYLYTAVFVLYPEFGERTTKAILTDDANLPLDHDWLYADDEAWELMQAPTCEDKGYERNTCQRCGVTKDRDLPANGHRPYVKQVEATCTQPGGDYIYCLDCEKLLRIENEVPQLDHVLDYYVWKDGVEPNCDHGGTKLFYCANCHQQYDQEDVAARAHDWDDGVTISAATCLQAELIEYTCRYDDCNATKVEPGEGPLGHLDENPVDGICDRCGESMGLVNPFDDVKPTDYYYGPVLWAAGLGITTGTTETTFSPDGGCTRKEAVTFLWRAFGSPEPTATGSFPFTDVPADSYYYKAVRWAVGRGITKGMTATTFGPDNYCTRAHVVTFLWRAEGGQSGSGGNETPVIPIRSLRTLAFTDVKPTDYFYQAVLWAIENEITYGMTETAFWPHYICTRAQIVTFLYRDLAA